MSKILDKLELPYAELDILGSGRPEGCGAGSAALAELAQRWGGEQHDLDRLTSTENDALQKRANALQHEQEEQIAPALTLDRVIVNLAYAHRLLWFAGYANGSIGERGCGMLGIAIGDLILMREAEVARREREAIHA